MLFNEPVFLFLYLPVVLIGYDIACSYRLQRVAIWWLLVASVAFYVYDDVGRLLPLIAGSIALNHVSGTLLRRKRSAVILAAGVGANLVLRAARSAARSHRETRARRARRRDDVRESPS